MLKLGQLLAMAGTLGMAACGGGSSPSITFVAVNCSPPEIQYGQTSQCSAIVTGTGNFNSAVTWTASAGSISTSGLFTAPSAGDRTLLVTIAATSVQDTSKSGTFKVAVVPELGLLGDRLDAVAGAANKGTHDNIVSKEEADRYVVCTYLAEFGGPETDCVSYTLSELSANKKQFGVPSCLPIRMA